MKFFTLAFALLLLVAPSPARAQKTETEDVPVKDVGGFKVGKDEWRVLIIPKGVSREALAKLAKVLHEASPSIRYQFFDDDKEMPKYLMSKRGLSAPFPEKWFNRHLVARLQTMANGRGGPRWYLLDADTAKIADLGPYEPTR